MLGFLVNELLVNFMKSIDCLGKLLLRLLILGQESILVAEIYVLLEHTIVEVLLKPQRCPH
jgi:hypothetical protein